MVALRSPLLDLQLDPIASLYVGHLERQLLAYQINDIKYRALLEMLTGEAWDSLATDLENKQLFDIAVALTEKKMGLTNMEARKVIRQRQALANSAEDGTNKTVDTSPNG
jgi:hypothetical protein